MDESVILIVSLYVMLKSVTEKEERGFKHQTNHGELEVVP
jgi:hypothetical protein